MRNATTPPLDCPSPFKDFRVGFYGRSEWHLVWSSAEVWECILRTYTAGLGWFWHLSKLP
jgi:hypothetical protein